MIGGLEHEHRTSTDITVAFAFALIKSKPSNLTVKDYIFALRNHVSPCDHGAFGSNPAARMDAKSYWRARSAQLGTQLECALRESFDQKLEIEALRAGLKSSDTPTTDRKRKRQAADTAVQLPAKKIRQEASQLSIFSVSSHNLTGTYHNSSLKVLLPGLFRLLMLLEVQKLPKITDASYYIDRSSEVLSQVLHELLNAHQKDKSHDTSRYGLRGLKEDLTAFNRAFTMLVTCCRLVKYSSGETAIQGKTVYTIVQVFNQIANTIKNVSRQAAASAADQEHQQYTIGMFTRSKAKLPEKTLDKDAIEAVDIVNALAATLENSFDILDPGNDVHKDLFEGFAYCVLSRLGDQMFAVVFDRERGPTLESEILRSGVAQGECHDEGAVNLDVRIKLEAPCWVHLLKRVMSAAPRFFDLAADDGNIKTKRPSDQPVRKASLTAYALDRLQRTLVHCILGVRDHDRGEVFGDCLRMPVADETQIRVPQDNDLDIREWFKEEVWGVLGWEILSKESFH